jgi:exodeoxyribonuclease III
MVKLISWNVNGVRAVNRKGVLESLIMVHKPDVLCLQEIKCDDTVSVNELQEKYAEQYPYVYVNTSKTKKGYSGTTILSNFPFTKVTYDLPSDLYENKEDGADANREGRVITAWSKEHKFVLVNVYTPNSGDKLQRLRFRVDEWDVNFRKYVKSLQNAKGYTTTVVCGDLNSIHSDIDIHNPKIKAAGSMPEERANLKILMDECELSDTFRMHHKDTVAYSYWSNMGGARAKNKGWRIDYFLVSKKTAPVRVIESNIITQQMGSDHAPILLELN